MTELRAVAALYIDPRGPYPTIARKLELGAYSYGELRDKFGAGTELRLDCWDEQRDARLYDGPHPIVAHPPCGPWTSTYLRQQYKGNDRDCAERALEQVTKFGGILEHPARSTLWDYFALPKPGHGIDGAGGISYAVDQCDFGHVARKPTWLYAVRVPTHLILSELKRRRGTGKPTHWCSGGRNNKTGGSAPPGIKICSAQQRRRTPPAFAEFLVSLARSVDLSSAQRSA